MFFTDFFPFLSGVLADVLCACVMDRNTGIELDQRCPRSNWKTMKRQNREPEPPPKTRFTRSSSFINLPFLLSLHFPRIFLKQCSGFHQTNNKRPLWTFCVLYWFSSVGFRTRSFYNIGPILRTTSCHTCNLVKLLGRSTHKKSTICRIKTRITNAFQLFRTQLFIQKTKLIKKIYLPVDKNLLSTKQIKIIYLLVDKSFLYTNHIRTRC